MDPGVANAADSGLADEVAAADVVVLSTRVGRLGRAQRLPRVSAPTSPTRSSPSDFCLVGDYDTLYLLYRRCP